MSPSLLLDAPPLIHHQEDMIQKAILDHLDEETVLSLDTLISLMPQCSWNQIFHSVDQLARSKKIVLRRHRFDYTLFSTNYAA